jgi:hypothetical protein
MTWFAGELVMEKEARKNRNGKVFQAFFVFVLLLILAGSAALTGCGARKTVEKGSTWVVNEKYQMKGHLTIKSGSTVKAPDGSLLTMTVDGAETAIQPGKFKGDIVLTPTVKISKALFDSMLGKGANTDYRTGLFVDGGQIIEKSSVTSALVGGTYDAHGASGVTINSQNRLFDGFILNNSDYRISNLSMTARGEGGSDFTGFGAGIAITGKSQVNIDNFKFDGAGPVRHGIFIAGLTAAEHPTVTVTNSFLQTNGSVGKYTGTSMAMVPWVLGLETTGHVRTQMIGGYANVKYENSTLLSDGWGVLSIDAPGKYEKGVSPIVLETKNSTIDITGTSGYGTYSIGGSRNIFDHTVMGGTKYATGKYGMTYAMVATGAISGGDFINGTNVTSRYGVMWHKAQTGVVNVDSSTFHTYGPVFMVKHCYPVVNVSKSNMTSDTGIIVQLMGSDDAGLMAAYYREPLDMASVAKDAKHDNFHVNKTNTEVAGAKLSGVVTDAQANFSEMEIKGDFYNSVSGLDDDSLHLLGQNLILNFDAVKLTGVISSAIASHRNYSLYFGKEKDANGKQLALNAQGYPVQATWGTEENVMHNQIPMIVPTKDAKGQLVQASGTKYNPTEGVITSRDALYLGDLVNHPAAAVNNGVLVALKNGTVWTVTGTSYLTGLTIAGGTITAPDGQTVELTVNGAKMPIENGSYTGNIVLSLAGK